VSSCFKWELSLTVGLQGTFIKFHCRGAFIDHMGLCIMYILIYHDHSYEISSLTLTDGHHKVTVTQPSAIGRYIKFFVFIPWKLLVWFLGGFWAGECFCSKQFHALCSMWPSTVALVIAIANQVLSDCTFHSRPTDLLPAFCYWTNLQCSCTTSPYQAVWYTFELKYIPMLNGVYGTYH
jgi:hypothetical protein